MTDPDFDLDTYAARWSESIHAALSTYTPPADAPPAVLHEAIRYSLFAGGKRLRPLLCVAGAEAVGGTGEIVLPTAAALEMIHTFSLIHDDLPALDNDDLRRGIPTLHRAFPEAIAILAGDALHTLAFAVIATHQTGSADAVLRVIRLLADACGERGMVGGQVDDILHERQPIDAKTLRSIHERKTGALLSASLLSGAVLSGATPAQEAALTRCGEQIGIAFQIVDDILDVTGDDATLGKPAGSDEKLDKATYPKLFGLDESRRLAHQAAENAENALTGFGASADPLRAFARFVVQRNT
ncbi:MAG: polyprenyl synthetase family protein [Armatimonadetes bacterium]|nr:polyprenyl synthetase family protein [Armatimonadota bacterium]